MRRDLEIGIIAGIVLAIIIGVFISTRTGVKEPAMPPMPLSHTYVGKSAGENGEQGLNILTRQPPPGIAELPEERQEEAFSAAPEQAVIQQEQAYERDEIEEIGELAEEEWEDEVVESEWEEIELPPTTIVEETKPDARPASVEVIESEPTILAVEDIIYKVKPNDTLTRLARQYYGDEAKWGLIYDANIGKISHRNALYVGQEIIIPGIGAIDEEPTVVELLSPPPVQEIVAPEEVEEVEEAEEAGERTHTVQRGDTLIKLSRQYYDNDAEWKKIYGANKNVIPNPNAILQGTVLIIPE